MSTRPGMRKRPSPIQSHCIRRQLYRIRLDDLRDAPMADNDSSPGHNPAALDVHERDAFDGEDRSLGSCSRSALRGEEWKSRRQADRNSAERAHAAMVA